MRKIFLLQLLLVCFAAQQLSAQVPGYRGKRFSAGYNASSFFYFAGFSMQDEGLGGVLASTRLSYKTELYVNYALSRKTNIGFSYYHGNQKNYFKDQAVDNRYVTPRVDAVHCRINAFELHIKFFKNNFVAPVGLYYQMGIGLVKYNLNEPGDTLALMDLTTNYHTFTVRKPLDAFTCMKLSFHVGKTNPIGNYLYINTAIGVNFFTGGDFNWNYGDDGIYSNSSVNTYLLKNFNKGLLSHNMAEIKVGLGWLAF
jgi:hypothetical protein